MLVIAKEEAINAPPNSINKVFYKIQDADIMQETYYVIPSHKHYHADTSEIRTTDKILYISPDAKHQPIVTGKRLPDSYTLIHHRYCEEVSNSKYNNEVLSKSLLKEE